MPFRGRTARTPAAAAYPCPAVLTLHSHPFASYCWKVLVALYENDTPFEAVLVDLGDPAARAAFLQLNPLGKMPVLHDGARDRIVTESSIVIEYLALHYPGPVSLLPGDPERMLEVRAQDRFFDLHVHEPMQAIVADRLRPADRRDPLGVQQARDRLRLAYRLVDARMAARTWAAGDDFSLADCAAAPALYYANEVEPLGDLHPNTAAYLARLLVRPSFARVRAEAAPFQHLFPRA